MKYREKEQICDEFWVISDAGSTCEVCGLDIPSGISFVSIYVGAIDCLNICKDCVDEMKDRIEFHQDMS